MEPGNYGLRQQQCFKLNHTGYTMTFSATWGHDTCGVFVGRTYITFTTQVQDSD